jgi:hypothetical protein
MCRHLSEPAPLPFATLQDLISRQRIASYDFYVSTTGDEWTNNYLWAEEFTTHCLWYGVDCDAVTGHTTVFQAS